MHTKSFTKKYLVPTTITILSILGYGVLVFAAPNFLTVPIGGYTPGTELDPICPPNSTDCFVKTVVGESTTANNGLTLTGTNVQLGGTLSVNTDINTATKFFSITNPYASTEVGNDGLLTRNWIRKTISPTELTVVGVADLSPFGLDTDTVLLGRLDTLGGPSTRVMITPTAGYISSQATNDLSFDAGNNFSVNAGNNVNITAGSMLATFGVGKTIAFDPGNSVANLSSYSDGFSFNDQDPLSTDINVYLSSNIGTSIAGARQAGTFTAHLDKTWDSGYYNLIDAMNNPHAQLFYGTLDAFNNITDVSRIEANPWEAHLFHQGNMLIVDATGMHSNSDVFLSSYSNVRDDSGTFTPVNFLYTDASGKVSSSPLGSGTAGMWSLTGNAGTIPGTNFIGTTDAQDFVVKINTLETARFGQDGNVSLGLASFATGGDSSFAQGSATASGKSAIAMGYDGTTASGGGSVAIGHSLIASGNFSTAFGTDNFSRSYAEFTSGLFSTDYVPQTTSGYDALDRLFTIGNGNGGLGHNAYTLWKDGSFAYNDDNFQNDAVGTEQNMFYFNYGSHDGLGTAQTKRAIRLGSALNDEWDINSVNVGDSSIALGFSKESKGSLGPIASGNWSFAVGRDSIASESDAVVLGRGSIASGSDSVALGNSNIASGGGSVAFGFDTEASGDYSTALGIEALASGNFSTAFGNSSISLGESSTAFGANSLAAGNFSTAFGGNNTASSFIETVLGISATDYVALDTFDMNGNDRLFTIGNGDVMSIVRSDALTILKDGRTAVAVDNFEANALPLATSVFQVGDGGTGIIGYVDILGSWQTVSDERKKHNIADLAYGLTDLMKLRPVSFAYNRNNQHTIGFLAQQVLPIIPESVGGSDSEGYSMSYATLVPVTVKAIQELNIKLDAIESSAKTVNQSGLVAWFADAANGIESFISKKITTRTLCIADDQGETCVTRAQLNALMGSNATQVITHDDSNTVTDDSSSSVSSTEIVSDTASGSGSSTQEISTPTINEELPLQEQSIQDITEIVQ